MKSYPDTWEDIARKVKDDAGWTCKMCGHPHDPKAEYTLTVHHLDGVKTNCDISNLIALCQRCHLATQKDYLVLDKRQLSLWE